MVRAARRARVLAPCLTLLPAVVTGGVLLLARASPIWVVPVALAVGAGATAIHAATRRQPSLTRTGPAPAPPRQVPPPTQRPWREGRPPSPETRPP